MRTRRTAEEWEELLRRRAELILAVQGGRLTAKEAARQLGVSRKTYYQWERRALSGMAQALRRRPGGRPRKAKDPEKESLKKRVDELEARERVREQVERIRQALKEAETAAGKK